MFVSQFTDLGYAFKKDYTVSGEFDVKLLDYITETFPKSQLTAPDYAQSLIEQILFNQMVDKIRASYEKFGFLPLDTPVMELSEILLAKYIENNQNISCLTT